jgi:hypothetical protein
MSASPLHMSNANMLERIEKEAAKVSLKINVNKSKEMHIALNNNETLCMHSETIEGVTICISGGHYRYHRWYGG